MEMILSYAKDSAIGKRENVTQLIVLTLYQLLVNQLKTGHVTIAIGFWQWPVPCEFFYCLFLPMISSEILVAGHTLNRFCSILTFL